MFLQERHHFMVIQLLFSLLLSHHAFTLRTPTVITRHAIISSPRSLLRRRVVIVTCSNAVYRFRDVTLLPLMLC